MGVFAKALPDLEAEIAAIQRLIKEPNLAFSSLLRCDMPMLKLSLYDPDITHSEHALFMLVKISLWLLFKLYFLQAMGFSSALDRSAGSSSALQKDKEIDKAACKIEASVRKSEEGGRDRAEGKKEKSKKKKKKTTPGSRRRSRRRKL